MATETKSVNVDFEWGGVLFVVFLVLKLTHVIDWSWWWVTAPLWIGAALAIAILLVVFLAAVILDRD